MNSTEISVEVSWRIVKQDQAISKSCLSSQVSSNLLEGTYNDAWSNTPAG